MMIIFFSIVIPNVNKESHTSLFIMRLEISLFLPIKTIGDSLEMTFFTVLYYSATQTFDPVKKN